MSAAASRLFAFLADTEEDVRALDDLSALLNLLHEGDRDDFTPAEAAGVHRVLVLQRDHVLSLLMKWSDAHEAVAAERRRAHG